MTNSPKVPTLQDAGEFLRSLEAGELYGDLTEKINEICAELNDYAQQYPHAGNPKATLTLGLSFKLTGGEFEIVPKLESKLPAPPRGRTILWSTPGNRFSPANPRQMQLFGTGVRDISTRTAEADLAAGDAD